MGRDRRGDRRRALAAARFDEAGVEREDLGRAELIAVPITLLLLVVFGGIVAAALPLAVGAIAMLGTYLSLYVLGSATDVSIFAINLTTALGLVLAIDDSLASSPATARSGAAGDRSATPSCAPSRQPAGDRSTRRRRRRAHRAHRHLRRAAAVGDVLRPRHVTRQLHHDVRLGLGLAVLMDAFVIRGTLVPALMKLAGATNWWAPRRLRRLHARFGIREHESAMVGAHAGPG